VAARDRELVADVLRLAYSVGILALLIWCAVKEFGAW
jgi:hypothetical protein